MHLGRFPSPRLLLFIKLPFLLRRHCYCWFLREIVRARLTCAPDTAFLDNVTMDEAFLLLFKITFRYFLHNLPTIKTQLN